MRTRSDLQEEIFDLFRSSSVATVCSRDGDSTHAFCCFYAFDPDAIHLLFKSKADAKHSRLLLCGLRVSGTIISSHASILNNRGIQFEGIVIPQSAAATQAYYLKYPFAVGVPGAVYTIRIDKIKFTSTIAGVRRKLAWARNNV